MSTATTAMLRAVIVDPDAGARAAITRELAGAPGVVVVGEFDSVATAVVQASSRRPDVVIVEATPVALGSPSGVPPFEQLVRALSDAMVVATGSTESAEFVVRVIRAGALEFLRKPVARVDLVAALDKVRRVRRHLTPDEPRGRVVAVFSPKGGLGTTTVATNVAVHLARFTARRALLVELDSGASDVATFLNLRPAYSVVDALRNVDRLDESLLQGFFARHESGLAVLPAPAQVEPELLAADAVRATLELARAHFDHVILDLRHDWDPATVAALAVADTVLFLTSLNVAALRAAAAGLAAFARCGLDRSRVKVVLIREGAAEDVTTEQATELLGLPISWKVPNDYAAAIRAINSGRPVVVSAPYGKLARNLGQLAATLAPRRSRAPTASSTATPAPLLRQLLMPWRLLGVGG